MVEQGSPVKSFADGTAEKARRPGLLSVTRTGVLLILAGHLIACAGVFWLMPGGWNWLSVEMLVYRLMPVGIGGLILAAVLTRNVRVQSIALEVLRGLWFFVGVFCGSRATSSFLRLAVACFLATAVLTIAARVVRVRESWSWLLIRLAGCAAFSLAVLSVLRSPQPSTIPANEAFGQPLPEPKSMRASVSLDGNVRLDPTQANVTFGMGRRFVQIEPLLTFLQRSPDETWTIFSPRSKRRPPTREYLGLLQKSTEVRAAYVDHDTSPLAEHQLTISKSADGDVAIEAACNLLRPVFAHLNTFTQITVAGHKSLSIAFSPIPGKRFEVPHAGYPFGEPATFAYVGSDRQFHVVRASGAEKGPFTQLGSGPIREAITLHFYDGEEMIFEIDFEDFARQASTALSPAAGWGTPQNAIEFGRLSEDPKSPATVFLSLASTSIGRGWSSVGHTAGTYRNRLVVRLPDNKAATPPAD